MEFKKYKRVSSSVELKALTIGDIRELVANDYKVVTNSGEVKVSISEKDQKFIDSLLHSPNMINADTVQLYLAHSGDTDYWCVFTEFASENYFCEVLDASKLGTFDFGTAVNLLKLGYKVSRSGWNGKGMFIYYVPANSYPMSGNTLETMKGLYKDDLVPYQAYIAMKTADNTVVPWLASQSDVLAEDWVVVK